MPFLFITMLQPKRYPNFHPKIRVILIIADFHKTGVIIKIGVQPHIGS